MGYFASDANHKCLKADFIAILRHLIHHLIRLSHKVYKCHVVFGIIATSQTQTLKRRHENNNKPRFMVCTGCDIIIRLFDHAKISAVQHVAGTRL